MLRRTSLLLAGMLLLSLTPTRASAATVNVRDVPPTHPDRAAIEFLNRHDVIYGYPDGTFLPDAAITRAEILKIALEANSEGRTALLTASTAQSRFNDVDASHTLSTYIAYAADHGYISGYADGSFRPNSNVTRAEAAKILANILAVVAPDAPNPYTDLDNSSLKPFIVAVAGANWFRPTPPMYNPNIPITRGEVASAAYGALLGKNAGSGGTTIYEEGMHEPMTLATDWQASRTDTFSFALPPGWEFQTQTEEVGGATATAIGSSPATTFDEATFIFSTVEITDPEDFEDFLERRGDDGTEPNYSDLVEKQIAVDAYGTTRTVTVYETREITENQHLVVWFSGATMYVAGYDEGYLPGQSGTFYRFVQYALELNPQS